MKRLILLVAVALGACTQHHPEIDDFETVREIADYEVIYADRGFELQNIAAMKSLDGLLVLKLMNDTFHFALVDPSRRELLCRFGRLGRGPGEYLAIGSRISVRDSCLVFLDMARKEIVRLRLGEVLASPDAPPAETERFPYTASFRPIDIAPAQGVKIAVGAFPDSSLGMLDDNGEVLDVKIPYPFAYDGIEDIYKGAVYQSEIEVAKAGDRFVRRYFASDLFEIYGIENRSVRKIAASNCVHPPKLHYKPRPGIPYAIDYEESVAGLLHMSVTDEGIYLSFSDESYARAADNGLQSNELLFFDWSGNPVVKYLLPIEIGPFCVDGDWLYAVRDRVEYPEICRFALR